MTTSYSARKRAIEATRALKKQKKAAQRMLTAEQRAEARINQGRRASGKDGKK